MSPLLAAALLLAADARAAVQLEAAGGRAVTAELAHPACVRGRRYPLVLFSHGANSAPGKYAALTGAWAARGFVVAAPLHADSPGHPGGGKGLTPAQSWAMRVEDLRLAADSADRVAAATGCAIHPRRIAAAGHSYGALIAQALGGALVGAGPAARDPRVTVVIAFSPPGPIPGYVTAEGWAASAVPMFVQTGTADIVPGIAPRWEDHLASWQASRTPGVLLVGAETDHYFGNRIGRPERAAPSPLAARAFDASLELSSDFLAAHLKRDPAARRRLAPDAVHVRWGAALARYEQR